MTDTEESTMELTMTTEDDTIIGEQLQFSMNITNDTVWIQNGSTVAGGNGRGSQLNRLSSPHGITINDDAQVIYIADSGNDRVVKWKYGAKSGEVVVGGNHLNELNFPVDVLFDRKNNSLIICDQGNRRVVRVSLRNPAYQQIIISDMHCYGLAMDNSESLYVSDCEKHEIKQWRKGEIDGTVVAGGNGIGTRPSQLNFPTYIFIDEDYSLYVSDSNNSRIIKWLKGIRQGTTVAGIQGQGSYLVNFLHPRKVILDRMGNLYIADSGNHRIMRWLKNQKPGSIVVGGNGNGQQSNQLHDPVGIAFDQQGNLYVTDSANHRVQKFNIGVN
ncbi:unnamed protein product [Adineta steineri]|uniref:NHL repeat containing protein n=3 Tax=Adineta steineri TaxID=433720 RepID=A0A813NBI9_9BILA|nr:unnamed protein product [Adineta steineri]